MRSRWFSRGLLSFQSLLCPSWGVCLCALSAGRQGPMVTVICAVPVLLQPHSALLLPHFLL